MIICKLVSRTNSLSGVALLSAAERAEIVSSVAEAKAGNSAGSRSSLTASGRTSSEQFGDGVMRKWPNGARQTLEDRPTG